MTMRARSAERPKYAHDFVIKNTFIHVRGDSDEEDDDYCATPTSDRGLPDVLSKSSRTQSLDLDDIDLIAMESLPGKNSRYRFWSESMESDATSILENSQAPSKATTAEVDSESCRGEDDVKTAGIPMPFMNKRAEPFKPKLKDASKALAEWSSQASQQRDNPAQAQQAVESVEDYSKVAPGQIVSVHWDPQVPVPVPLCWVRAVQRPMTWEWQGTTTVMMRNIPNRYTQALLRCELDRRGFEDQYNFIYVPMDSETNANKGYAFINFYEDQSALAFKREFENRKLPRFNSTKYVEVSPATVQGFERNVALSTKSLQGCDNLKTSPLFVRYPNETPPPNEETASQGKDVDERDDSGGESATPKCVCRYCKGTVNPSFRFCQWCGKCLMTPDQMM